MPNATENFLPTATNAIEYQGTLLGDEVERQHIILAHQGGKAGMGKIIVIDALDVREARMLHHPGLAGFRPSLQLSSEELVQVLQLLRGPGLNRISNPFLGEEELSQLG